MEVNEDENLAVEALGQLGNCCRTWTCEFCDVLFFTESEYNDHLQSHGENENIEYHCSKCQEKFKVKVALDAHELTHLTSEKLEYQCNVCLMWFQRLSSLKNHEKVHLPNTVKDLMSMSKQIISKRGRKPKMAVKEEPPSPAFELISSSYSPKEESEEGNSNNYDSEQFFETDENYQSDTGSNKLGEMNSTSTAYNGTNYFPPVEDSKPHACIFCAKKFAREKALLSHMKLHDDNFEAIFLTCAKCESSFDDLSTLQNHITTCLIKTEPVQIDSDGSDDYFNPFIEKPTPKKYVNTPPAKRLKKDYAQDYDRSTLFRVSQGKYACDQCTKSFKTRQKLFRHVWIHRTKEHKCEICDMSFYTVGKLEDHMTAFHSADAKFVCDECGKAYNTQKSLTDHKNYHLVKARELCCPYCSKIFSSRQGFTIHQRIHTGERPYICEYCSKPFRDGATLRKHELIHTGERPFKCPICESAFNQKVVLREHIRGVHVGKAKQIICELCKEEKIDSESLSEHLVKHSDEIRGPVLPRKRNPFIIRWAGQEVVVPKKSTTIVNKKILLKKGRPKMTNVKPSALTERSTTKKKLPALKNKKNVALKRQRNSKGLKHTVVPIRKSSREKKSNQNFSNYIQEDLDLLLELSKGEESKTKNVPSKEVTPVKKNKTPKSQPRNKKSAAVTPKVSSKKPLLPVSKRKRASISRKSNDVENTSFSNHKNKFDKTEVKSTILVGARNSEVVNTPVLSFTEVCAMCNERFSSREELLTHVTVHI